MLTTLLRLLLGLNAIVLTVSVAKLRSQANLFKETPELFWLGIFVWGDAVLIAPYWMVVSVLSWWRHDHLLFWLCVCGFWLVRSTGEMVYWLNQQFSTVVRDPKEKFWHYRWFKEAVWFVNQVMHQLIMVVSLVGIILVSIAMLKR